MKKIVALGIISLFVMTSTAALPCISATITAPKLNEIVVLNQDETYSIMCSTRGNPPLPPVMWTEDFSTFCISTPQDPDGDNIYYLIDWGDGNGSGWIGPYESGETVCISHVWDDEGTYQIKIKAKDQDGESKCTVYSLTLSSDIKFFGVEIGYVDITYTFTIYWKGCDCYIMIDWGNGEPTDWIGPYEQPVLFSHTWSLPGEYVLRFKIKDLYGNESDWLTLKITILTPGNNAPNPPIIKGPTHGEVGVKYDYSFNSTDPDGDDIAYYLILWDDDTHTNKTGSFASGEPITASHKWTKKGTYTVYARATDVFGKHSYWGELTVTMPRNKIATNPFLRFFEQYLILQKLLVYLIK